MHKAVREWVRAHRPASARCVLECGSRDINGTPRDLFGPDIEYTGVDPQGGPGVDVVADFAEYVHPRAADLVLCLEVLEHTPAWRALMESAARNLRTGGVLIVTCATHGRTPHSARGGGPIGADEHYANIDRHDLESVLTPLFEVERIEVRGTDLRALARRR